MSSPVPFLQNVVTGTTVPAFITAVPNTVQAGLASTINKGLEIIAPDFETSVSPAGAYPMPTGKGHAKPTGIGKNPMSTATGGSASSNGTNPTSRPVTFTGGASRTAATGGLLIFAGTALLLVL